MFKDETFIYRMALAIAVVLEFIFGYYSFFKERQKFIGSIIFSIATILLFILILEVLVNAFNILNI